MWTAVQFQNTMTSSFPMQCVNILSHQALETALLTPLFYDVVRDIWLKTWKLRPTNIITGPKSLTIKFAFHKVLMVHRAAIGPCVQANPFWAIVWDSTFSWYARSSEHKNALFTLQELLNFLYISLSRWLKWRYKLWVESTKHQKLSRLHHEIQADPSNNHSWNME